MSSEPEAVATVAAAAAAPTPAAAAIEDRIELFRVEWTDYIKNRLAENYRFIHLWRAMFATRQLTTRMSRMANKYFQGILTVPALNHINICIVQFIGALSALHVALPADTQSLEVYHKFAEQYFKENFEHMYCWNWPLTEKNPADLKPVRDDPVDAPYDPEANHGFPSFINIRYNDECSCCSDGSEEYSEEDEEASSGGDSE